MPKVSVVVPVYNNEKYVRRCVESLLAQTLVDIEILAVNDGSTDSSSAILHEYADTDSRVIVIDKENSGYGVNINLGFARATGDYVGILESDDFCTPDFLEKLYGFAMDNDLEISRANFNLYWSTPTEREVFLELFSEDECGHVIDPRNVPDQHCFYVQPAIWSAIYKRSFIEENKLKLLETPGAAYQDTGFNFKVWACARRVGFIHEPLINYRQDNEASSINNPGKVFTICGEYEEIERWLTEERPDLRELLAPVAAKMRWDAYTWNVGRIAPELRPDFVTRMHDDFAELKTKGELDRSKFPANAWFFCNLCIDDPEAYLRDVAVNAESLSGTENAARKARLGIKCLGSMGLGGLRDVMRS